MSSASILYLLSALLFCSSAALIVLARQSAWIRRVFGAERMVEDVLETDFFDDSGEFTRPLSRVSGIVALPPARTSSGFERPDDHALEPARFAATGRSEPLQSVRTTGSHTSVAPVGGAGAVQKRTVAHPPSTIASSEEGFWDDTARNGTSLRAIVPLRNAADSRPGTETPNHSPDSQEPDSTGYRSPTNDGSHE